MTSYCVWCLALPVTIVCGLVLQLPFLLVYTLMLLCEDLPKIILCIRRFHSRKWIQPVTAQGAETLSSARSWTDAVKAPDQDDGRFHASGGCAGIPCHRS